MEDQSYLERKYFIDGKVYNCPFCNIRNVAYKVVHSFTFDWSNNKECHGILVKCASCEKKSIHFSYEDLGLWHGQIWVWEDIEDIDSVIFYSRPTSFFVMDSRIPRIIRELIAEAEGCLKMNFLTGASACMRKAIYELLFKEKAQGADYETKIKSLKQKFPSADDTSIDILAHIQDMTSDKIHEQSWDKWDAQYLKLIIEALKTILHDIYVIPQQKAERSKQIQQMRESLIKDKKGKVTE